ncbi:MAG: ABC-type transporter involved in resistance to organic solvent, permease protein [Deltaproteobacteria bacterium]|nr:ABC-type transporter involved in resistance to organic solvent, permease protein [Deltaproteobacteria bacterium]
MVVSLLGRIGRLALDQIAGMGRLFLFLVAAVFQAFRPPAKIHLIIYHIKTIGVDSLSVVVLSGFFTGMVMGFQGYYSLRKFNAESWLGSATALGLLRELGPVLSAFMVTGRTGSAMAAELGTMRATEQIDALYSMAINPIKYLVSPRIIASLIAMPLLTAGWKTAWSSTMSTVVLSSPSASASSLPGFAAIKDSTLRPWRRA